MKEGAIKNLIEKYKAGTSSLVEEKNLVENLDKLEPTLKIWFAYVKMNKNEVPKDLNAKLWKSFEKRNIRKPKFRISTISIAASILLVIAIYIGNGTNNKLNYRKKEALLKEAQNMFKEPIQNKQIHNIIVESDLIVVYTKTE
ncbi:hypothetical protein [uncultured Polaribacter sp.]|uniref:hypothetical protein n=1 Tax=uncultured Polaribacter sp. TaxID=174711 RepID=UPI002604AA80|nr:hypothetical protein [uncultured Polaribacter sp.]